MQLKLKVSAADITRANELVLNLAKARKQLDEWRDKLDRSDYDQINVSWLGPKPPSVGDPSGRAYVTMVHVDYVERCPEITGLLEEILVARVLRIEDEIGALGIELEDSQ